MQRIYSYLLVISLVFIALFIATKVNSPNQGIQDLAASLKPIHTMIDAQRVLSFEPKDSLELYFSCQMHIAPILLDRNPSRDTILSVLDKKSNTQPTPHTTTIWETQSADYIIRLEVR